MATRVQWSALPLPLTRWAEQELGGAIVHATSQTSGFSSGSADRLETANGRRAFMKAASRDRNSGTFELHRREADVMRTLPASIPAPTMLGVFDDDEWVALLFAEVDGKHPSARDDAATVGVLDMLSDMPAALGPLGALPQVRDEIADDFDGWDRLVADGAESGLPPRAQALLDRMIDASTRAGDAVAGNHLVHLDCRTDNILMDSTGSAWIVDWPWASVGPRWFDGLTYLLDVVMHTGPAAVDRYLGHAIFDEMSPDAADAVLASLAGAWYDSTRRPAPPGMPTIRGFQKAEADAAVAWLSHRWA